MTITIREVPFQLLVNVPTKFASISRVQETLVDGVHDPRRDVYLDPKQVEAEGPWSLAGILDAIQANTLATNNALTAEIAATKADRDAKVAEANAERDAATAALAGKDATIAERDATIAALQAQLDAAQQPTVDIVEWIKDERDRRIQAGVKVGDDWFKSDIQNQIIYIGMVMQGARLAPDTPLWTMDGRNVGATPQRAGAVFAAIGAHMANLFQIAAQAEAAYLANPQTFDREAIQWPPIFQG